MSQNLTQTLILTLKKANKKFALTIPHFCFRTFKLKFFGEVAIPKLPAITEYNLVNVQMVLAEKLMESTNSFIQSKESWVKDMREKLEEMKQQEREFGAKEEELARKEEKLKEWEERLKQEMKKQVKRDLL